MRKDMKAVGKYYLFIVLLFILNCNVVVAQKLIHEIILPNTNIEAYFDFKSVLKSGAVIKFLEELPGIGGNYPDLKKAFKKHGLKLDDFNEFAIALGLKNDKVASVFEIDIKNIDLVFAISMSKQINLSLLEEILKDILVENNSTVSIVKYNEVTFVKTTDMGTDLYLTISQDGKSIIGGYIDSVMKVLNGKKQQIISDQTQSLSILDSLNMEKYNIYFKAAFPKNILDAVFKNVIPKEINDDVISPEMLKKITAFTMGFETSDNIIIDVNTYFLDNESAEKYFKLVSKHYIPLLKEQFLISAKGKPFPFLDNIQVSLPTETDVQVKYTITKKDLSTFAGMVDNENP